ncbi:proton-conducting transporter membrane subunit [Trebonia sp.]|uniref:proton-conducting transporter transmembrane domain-containing protein n=1 Tax=Trebonia sp. TaxID=2767075 RepID=UPI00260350E8|nr:proton-conducting transporter membrane subunit [Trebonia sp.]
MMLTLMILTWALPLGGAIVPWAGASARGIGIASAAGGAGSLAAAIALAVSISPRHPLTALGGFVYVDSLSAFFVITVALVVTLAGIGSYSYLQAEAERGELSALQVRLYGTFFGLFAALMLAALQTGNLGLLWVLVEGSTLASAVLVALEARATSLEAAWKYIIISSFGVTIALVGTLFVYYSAILIHVSPDQRLTWPTLFAHASVLQAPSLRFAFLLVVVGYGTKVGLAPMHTWLPDAHSEAPSPASAMLSAALLNTGMYAIIRFKALTTADLGRFSNDVLLVFGFASLAVGALFMIGSDNFKRLFAYSSIEHMGLIAIGLGFGGLLGIYGALLQTFNHAIGKSVLFLTSGEIVLRYKTRNVVEVRGLLRQSPVIGGALLLGSLAIVGSPPFGIFLSEFTIVRASFAGHAWLGFFLLALLVIAFVALTSTTVGMVFGRPPGDGVAAPGMTSRVIGTSPLVPGLGLLLLLGVWIPGGLNELILQSIKAIT